MFLDNKVILITGGAGSFGQKFIEYLVTTKVKKIVIYSRDEYKHYQLYKKFAHDSRIRCWIGDVRDKDKLCLAFSGVDYVVHAAALKQVPSCEYNPIETVKTNVLGTAAVMEAAIRTSVKRAVLLSTDKSVNAINLYGSTKATAEKLFLSGNFYKPVFNVVRYGNVMGSRGSVLNLYRELIENGEKELPLTHPGMTRFWYTFILAINLVVRALQGPPALTYVGRAPSFYIIELIQALDGKEKIIGIRPGEKLHETLINSYEAKKAFKNSRDYIITPEINYGWNIHYKQRPLIKEYTSINNDEWLIAEDICSLIK